MTDIVSLDPDQIYKILVIIFGLGFGGTGFGMIKMYLQALKKDLHIIRLAVDSMDDFAQDPNDQNWTNAWNNLTGIVRKVIPSPITSKKSS